MYILSWNVNGLRAIVKKGFYESVKKINPVILCLQETKTTNQQTIELLNIFEGYHIFSNSALKKGYSGTALLSKVKPIKLTYTMAIKEYVDQGRIICAEFKNLFLVNVYVPNAGQQLQHLNGRKLWETHFLTYLKRLKSYKPVVVCGDLNVAYQPIDLKNDKANYNKTAGYTQVEIDGMHKLLKAGFIDSFRYLYPNKIAYSYWSYRYNARVNKIGWRIDYFLIDKVILKHLKEAGVYSDILGSDHCPVGVKLDLPIV